MMKKYHSIGGVIIQLTGQAGDRFIQATGYDEPTWENLISQLADDPTPYDEWR